MDTMNRDRLSEFEGRLNGKVLWLASLLDDNSVDIEDPYDKAAEDVERIVERLANATDLLAARLQCISF